MTPTPMAMAAANRIVNSVVEDHGNDECFISAGYAAGDMLRERFAAHIDALTRSHAALVEACEMALRDFDGPVADLVKITKTHPFTLTPAQLREALSTAREVQK